jgi:hypothetical protein
MQRFADFQCFTRNRWRFCLAARDDLWLDGAVTVLESLIAELKGVCAGLPDQRKGPLREGEYTMADIGLSAFSVFFMGSPSFLGHQRRLEEGHGRSNRQTLFGMTAIPTDACIRLMLDGAPAAAFDPLFFKTITTEGVLDPFRRLDGRMLIALDGTECFCSRKIHCPRRSTRKRTDGGTEYFHSLLGASIVAPGHQQVPPLPADPRVKPKGKVHRAPGWRWKTGLWTQRREAPAFAGAGCWLARHGPTVAQLRPVFPGDDLFARPPIAAAVQQAGGNFIFTGKPASHQTMTEYLTGAELEEHRLTTVIRGKRTTTIYRWLSAVPMRATEGALIVNRVSIEILSGNGKRSYYNSFVTDPRPRGGKPAGHVHQRGGTRRLWAGTMEDRERNVQQTQDQRRQSRTQFRAR